MPVLIRLADDLGELLVTARADHELGHDAKELRLFVPEASQPAEVAAQPLHRRPLLRERRLEPRHRVADNGPYEVLFRREVVVQCRDVHTDRAGTLARAEPLEAARRDLAIGRRHELVATRLGRVYRFWHLTPNQSDD